MQSNNVVRKQKISNKDIIKLYNVWKKAYSLNEKDYGESSLHPLKCVDQILDLALQILPKDYSCDVDYLVGEKGGNARLNNEDWVIGKKLECGDLLIEVRIDYEPESEKSIGPHINLETFKESDKSYNKNFHIKNKVNYGKDGILKYVLWGRLSLRKDLNLNGKLSSIYKDYKLDVDNEEDWKYELIAEIGNGCFESNNEMKLLSIYKEKKFENEKEDQNLIKIAQEEPFKLELVEQQPASKFYLNIEPDDSVKKIIKNG
jgi:hypothetical protein